MFCRNRLDRSARLRLAGISLATSAVPLLLFRHRLHHPTHDALCGFLLGIGIALLLGGGLCRLRGRM